MVGGCDLYITKAYGGDKKLYKNIEHDLETKHQSNLDFSRSLSPPQVEMLASSLNLSRSSPFGNLGQISSRRTFAYLIATLNASHPDYDFSHLLRPTDFKRERSLRAAMNNLDTTLHNLRPRPASSAYSSSGPNLTPASAVQPHWGPGMWRLIDTQMTLKECTIYRYAPEDFDLFEDEEEGSIWSLNYFFFNKTRKRVCYIYLRGISALTHRAEGERPTTPMTPLGKLKRTIDEDQSDGWVTPDLGAHKRARYWFADREGVQVAETNDDDDTQVQTPKKPVVATNTGDLTPRAPVSSRKPLVDEDDNYILSDDDQRSLRSRSKSTVRGMSEDIAEVMEV